METIPISSLQGLTVGICLLIMGGGLFGVFHNRAKSGKTGIGARITQLTTVILTVPGIIIIATLGLIDGETIAALFGAILGYVLSGVGEFKNSSKDGGST